ncbi:MAG: c-type cytochrome [Verrucomicrobiota bacterium]
MKLPRLRAVLSTSIVCLVAPLSLKAELHWVSAPKQLEANSVTFTREFEINGPVKSATLKVAATKSGSVTLNGKILGALPARYEVGADLKPGKNVLIVHASEAKSNRPRAVAQLTIELADGSKQIFESGDGWLVASAAKDAAAPIAAADSGKYDSNNDVLSLFPAVVTAPADIHVPKDFKVELLYRVPKLEQGSWVALTVDHKGRILGADQYGGIYRITPAPLDAPDAEAATKVEPLQTEVKGIHGLIYAFNSLYVMVGEGPQKGIFRLTDTKGTDQFDKAELIVPLDGSGEHGPHSFQISPDGKSLYFCAGNHTKPPAQIDHVRGAQAWSEDHLLPRLWDANGHAKGILAPGGYIAKIDPDGKNLEMICTGFRNEFDFAFNINGDIFSYDADMEWDIGTPWYRPTRFNQAPSGGDFGWRSGAGKWPAYYADSLPATIDIGPGSPTGVTSGIGAKFPAKYQKAIFGNDWTYGTMYAIHLTPSGAGYKAEKEEFVTGKPLSLTDVIIRPQDGAMYFAIGGRRNQSALYRVTYTGTESTSPAAADSLPAEAKLRREIEALHVDGTGPEAVSKAWPHLASSDRFLRFAARVAVEKQPAAAWAEKALAETNPQASIEALIALARVGDKALQPRLIDALTRLDYRKIDTHLRLPLLRAWQLAFTRMGKPSPEACAKLAKQLDPLFPQKDAFENRELLQLLVFLDSPTVVSKAVAMMQTLGDDYEEIASAELLARNDGYAKAVKASSGSRPNKQQIAFAYTLRNAKAGWTPELHKEFFSWFPKTAPWQGGNSFAKFIQNIRADALENVTDATERAALDELSKKPAVQAANLVMPRGPGKSYSVDDIVELAKGGLTGRNFEHGKAMFATTQCATCHHFANEGGNIGPDLTGAGNRYSIRDLAESIIEPSKVISDLYSFQEIEKKDGSVVIGRVLAEENGKYLVMTNPFAPDATTQVSVAEVASRKEYGISPMPPGLINMLGPDEVLDLIAYLFSGGNPQDKAFAPAK